MLFQISSQAKSMGLQSMIQSGRPGLADSFVALFHNRLRKFRLQQHGYLYRRTHSAAFQSPLKRQLHLIWIQIINNELG